MPNKTPKTQNQWAGFQVRECNDYNEATGICHHEEAPVDTKGGLFGHYFPNNICKYFHRGRDGAAPRTFKQNISAGLINMDSVAEAILKQADKNIQQGTLYGGAAVREIHYILKDQHNILCHRHIHQVTEVTELSNKVDPSCRQAAARENYSKYLWQKIQEEKNTTSKSGNACLDSSRTGYHGKESYLKPGSKIPKGGSLSNSQPDAAAYGDNHRLRNKTRQQKNQVPSPNTDGRMDTINVRDIRPSATYDASMDDTQLNRLSVSEIYHPRGVHGHSNRENAYNYHFNYGKSASRSPNNHHETQHRGAAFFHNDLCFQGTATSAYENENHRMNDIRYVGGPFENSFTRAKSVYTQIPVQSKSIGFHENPASVKQGNIENMRFSENHMYELSADHALGEYRFHSVVMEPQSGVSFSGGFVSSVHFLKPPSSYHAVHYWSQLWDRACDEYNPQSDTCQHEKKLWKCSFPEKVCLHFHPGRNSEKRRTEILSSKHRADREFVAQVLITDCIDSDFSCNSQKNPVCCYIQANKITHGTVIKNELPSSFTVRTVDLPFHWPSVSTSEMVHMLPEIVFISCSPLFSESLLQPMMQTFGYDILKCVKRRTNTNEIQYFLWTSTRNAHYLKGLDSLFTLTPGKRPSVGIVVGDITICPAERFVQPSERLRFLLIDEVANYRVQFNMPKGYALTRKLNQIYFPREWTFRALLDDHKGLFRHILTRNTAPEASSIIRMNNHSIDYLTVDGSEYILYDRQLNEKELNVTKKSLLLYTPAYHTIDDVARVFHGIQEAQVMHYDRQRSLNLNLLAFYMRILKYIVHKRKILVNEVQVIIIGGRTVERSCEVNGIYKIFGANLSRPSHRVVTVRFKNETTVDGYPRYNIGDSAVSLSEVKEMLLSGQIGEVMEMVCLTGPTLIDACVADLPTVSTLEDQTHLLEDSTRLVILMSSEESWMNDLTAVQRLRNGNLDNMLVLVKTRSPREYFRANFENQNIILFDRTETAHARHCLRLFILSGIARHLIHMICHSNEKEDTMDHS